MALQRGGIWLSESEFVAFDRTRLSSDVVVRSRSLEWADSIFGYLPDPDPVLKKTGHEMTVYKMLLSDDQVWACMESRKNATLGCDWEIVDQVEGGPKSPSTVVKAFKEVMARLKLSPVKMESGPKINPNAIRDMLEAPFFGISPLEITWQAMAGKWNPTKLEGKPPEWFVFSTENELRFLSRDDQINGEELPPYKFLLATHHANYQNPYGERLLAKCFWPVTFKRGGWKFWVQFAEKYGMPWAVGKVNPGTGDDKRAILLTALKNMIQDAVAVINNDESIEFPEAKDKTASSQLYSDIISKADRAIAKAILGQTLTTEAGGEGGSGSYALGKVQEGVADDRADADKRMVADCFNQLAAWWTMFNFGENVPPPIFQWHEDEDVQTDRADRDKKLSESMSGFKFSRTYFERTYNLEKDDLEETQDPNELAAQADPNQPAVPAKSKKPDPDQKPGQAFAENVQDATFQQDVDDLTRRAANASGTAVQALAEAFTKRIAEAKSYDEAAAAIYEVYPNLEFAEFEKILARTMFSAAASGAAGVVQEGEE